MSPRAERCPNRLNQAARTEIAMRDANALRSVRTMANAGTIEIQSHGETIRGEYFVDHDGVVRLRSDIREKGTSARKAEARWLPRRMLRELAYERALMRSQGS